MAARIEVERSKDDAFDVRVMEDESQTSHRVTLKDADYARLADANVSQEELIRRSFEFLLEHESKESILRRFDLMVIARYFPQYEREIKKRLSAG